MLEYGLTHAFQEAHEVSPGGRRKLLGRCFSYLGSASIPI